MNLKINQVNFSIGSKIKTSFLILTGVIFFTGLFTFLTLNDGVNILNSISNEVNPRNQLFGEFRNLIKDSKAYSTNWVYVKSYQKDKQKLQEIHTTTYPSIKVQLDSLIALQEADSGKLSEIKLSFENLLTEQEQIMMILSDNLAYEDPMNVFLCEDLIENTIIPGCDLLIEELDTVIAGITQQTTDLNEEMQSSFSSLNWLIIILGIIGVAFAIFISFILSNSITKPLNQLKSKIALLSQGEIPDLSDKSGNDEIGEIDRGINKLITSFRELANFAKEIGQGNLQYDFSALGENDALGQSLLSMRGTLKA